MIQVTTTFNYDVLLQYAQLAESDSNVQQAMENYIEKCVKQGTDINGIVDGVNGDTVLHRAVRDEKVKLIAVLLKNGANSTILNAASLNARQLADKHPHLQGKIVWEKFATSQSNQENCRKVELKNQIATCIKENNLEGIKGIAKHSKLFFKEPIDSTNKTWPHFAIEENQPRMLQWLLNLHFWEIDKKYEQGQTLLHFATSLGKKEIIEVLLDRAADHLAEDSQGQNPFHLAAIKGNLEIFNALKRPYMNPVLLMRMDSDYATPLHLAARYGNLSIISNLMGACYNLNALTKKERFTPLHEAAAHGHLEIVKLLIQTGADMGIKDYEGKTACERARTNGFSQVADYLASN